jgi:hypothetical protein
MRTVTLLPDPRPGDLELAFDYDLEIINVLRGLPRRRWDADRRR